MTYIVRVSFGGNLNANTAGYLTIAGDMPALQGSEKQIAWANEIRATKACELADYLSKGLKITFGVVFQADEAFIADIEAKFAAALAADNASAVAAGIAKVFGASSAKYWIDNRTVPASVLVQQAARQ